MGDGGDALVAEGTGAQAVRAPQPGIDDDGVTAGLGDDATVPVRGLADGVVEGGDAVADGPGQGGCG
ncbi:hypothetical protein EASAB2608_07688 [Streptomyces sp. EAS-AB2608]|nr:hypothetical protein [Streptomyces sp. SID7810]BCM72354.1 hypothetical protein EASAB2608_07688 [Streptomyces sp. EAS-AB2608]